ncbi:MAG: hypothetical protein ACLT40_05720 [Fusobacterium sp.]
MTEKDIENLIIYIYGENLSKRKFENLKIKLYEKYKDLEIKRIEDYLKIDEFNMLWRKNQRRDSKILKLSLDDYVNLNILTQNQATVIKEEFLNKKLFLITGPTASGKSHFSKKLLKLLKPTEYCEITSQDDYYLAERKIEELNYTRKKWRGRLVLDELNYENFEVFDELYKRHDGSLIIIHEKTAENALKMLEIYNERYKTSLYEKYSDYPDIYKKYIALKIDYVIVMKQTSDGVKVESVKKLCGFENGKYIFEEIR